MNSLTDSNSTISNESYTNDSIVNSIIQSFINRSNIGIEKYNTTLDRDDLAPLDWIKHAQEELMDGILYLEKLKVIMKTKSHEK
jgi:hypothetical protein